ncbi:pNP419L [African swine fever virus]|uniref:DNA ligase n=1 Tax=African swine fever virus TaxID=10497 RepID=A0A0C5BCS2_ASF|nr:BA71V-NP419L (g3L) [African swine fever virus]AJL34278.1 BA71V-NP419L (g3L) [African swine fever virus]AXB49328.1 pNP419L [African swine fever virus]AXB49502.1 pNP419L [African swine fever virus]AXB49674.1 pNP419L [African swine fever virus]AXB49845.1 pNP419L [African swine fever virus]
MLNQFPGQLSNNVFCFPPIESETKSGKKASWIICVQVMQHNTILPITDEMFSTDVKDAVAEIFTKFFVEEGAMRISKTTRVTEGKNLGKKNATTVVHQAFKDALSKYNRHARQKRGAHTNKGMIPPMLVKHFNIIPKTFFEDETDPIVQRKRNGVRAVACQQGDGSILLYSRTEKEFLGLDNIKKELKQLYLFIDVRVYLDGELYLHHKPLQWIAGQANAKADSSELHFYVFDCFWSDQLQMPSNKRQQLLTNIFKQKEDFTFIHQVENFSIKDEDEALRLKTQFIKEGYEGAIVRNANGPYEPGYNNYHSPHLAKLKPLLDAEFILVDYTQGKKGKDLGAILWVCELPNKKRFVVTPKHLTYADRYALFQKLTPALFKKHLYGKELTVEYAELSSKTGIPLQARAVGFREPINVLEII